MFYQASAQWIGNDISRHMRNIFIMAQCVIMKTALPYLPARASIKPVYLSR